MISFSDGRTYSPRGPLSDYGSGLWTPSQIGIRGFSLMAAVQLAMDHFNERDPSVVPELASEEFRTCDVVFPDTSVVLNTNFEPTTTFSALMNVTRCDDRKPCAVIGPSHGMSAIAAGAITQNLGVPQIAYDTSFPQVTGEFSNTVRMIPKMEDSARSLVDFLQRKGKERDFVYVLGDGKEFSTMFAQHLEEQSRPKNLKVLAEAVVGPDAEKDGIESGIEKAMGRMKQSGIHTILVALERYDIIPLIAKAADSRGLIGDDYFWVLTEEALPPQHISSFDQVADSPMDKLLRGAAVFSVVDGFSWDSDDKFLASWSNQTSPFVHRVNALNPLKEDVKREEYFEAKDDFFLNHLPDPHASYLYDSVIAVGIAACRARSRRVRPVRDVLFRGIPLRSNISEGISNLHIQEIMRTKFLGASGSVSIDNSRNREAKSAVFGAFNVRPGGLNGSLRSYHAVLVSHTNETRWTDVEGESFVFYDQTTNRPTLLREIQKENFLSRSVHITGLTLMSLSLAISIGSAGWVFWVRKTRIVRAAQPVFLYMLCFGSVVTALSILTVSFDESYGWSDAQLDAACTATPWLQCLGHLVVYSALFTKLMRVNKVLQFRRRTVQVHQVLWPFALLMLCAIIVLVVWTVVDPWRWERELINDKPPETFGECKSDNFLVFFAPLSALLISSTLLTAFMAWKTKDIADDFAESSHIFNAVFIQIQGWFVGLPVLVILEDSSVDASYVGRLMITWTFSVSTVVLVIWPKIAQHHFGAGRGASRAGTVRVSGINPPSVLQNSSLPTQRVSCVETSTEASSQSENCYRGRTSSNRVGFSIQKRDGVHGNTSDEALKRVSSLEVEQAELQEEARRWAKAASDKSQELGEASDKLALLQGDLSKKQSLVDEKDIELRDAHEKISLLERRLSSLQSSSSTDILRGSALKW